MEKIDVSKYPESLQIIAKGMDLPVPEDDTATREAIVLGLIGFVAGL